MNRKDRLKPDDVRLHPGSMVATMSCEVDDIILLPAPPSLLGLQASVDLHGLVEVGLAEGNFGSQRALVARALVDCPRATYRWDATEDAPAPNWVWSPPDHPLNRASPELTHHARLLVKDRSGLEAVGAVIDHVADVFRYGHGDGRFTDGTLSVPLVSCGLTRGTCVDIHTYAVAALRAAGIRAAYVAGVFWLGDDYLARDMHCWLLVDGKTQTNWDIAHDLIASRAPQPDLAACPGIRFPLSVGRGQRFSGSGIDVEISHFALPHRIRGDVAAALPTTFTRMM